MKIYNSQSREKEEFIPIEPGKVKMYVCGPTVYNFFHIGNARPFLVFDAFRRYLEYRGYEVTYVQNFTDVDDKIIAKANEENVDSNVISEKYIKAYYEDADALGICRATHHPKVTENIDEIIAYIETLIEKNHAYAVDGHVYFSVNSFKEYGKLSGQNLDELVSGARIEVCDAKKNPLDFVLWKPKKEGEPAWTSPWGEGRPGWHIECSVMSTGLMGETIDIHAGGQDLIFPHHENEVAQSEAYSGKKYVNYWMHNGYINIENKKMSKSLNNFFTTREILDQFDSEVVRFFMLSAHYRTPINFSRDLMDAAKNGLDRLYNAKTQINHLLTNALDGAGDSEVLQALQDFKSKFTQVMDDDFNTADGIATIFEMVRYLNTQLNEKSTALTLQSALDVFVELTGVLGIVQKQADSLAQEVEQLIEERQNARKNKDFAKSDAIRDTLKEMGIVLEDTPQGVKWHKVER